MDEIKSFTINPIDIHPSDEEYKTQEDQSPGHAYAFKTSENTYGTGEAVE